MFPHFPIEGLPGRATLIVADQGPEPPYEMKGKAMATLFRYGPYVWISEDGAPPGAVHAWSFGPWPCFALS